MTRTDHETLIERFTAARNLWLLYKPRLQEAYEFTQPYRNKFVQVTPGTRKGMEVYDTTAVTSTAAFTSKLQNALTPIGQRFMKIVAGKMIDNDIRKRVDDFLEHVNDIVWKYMEESNFSLAANESYLDLAIGTGALTVQSTEKRPLIFAAHPLCNVYLEHSTLNSIENVWREFNIPGAQATLLWPDATLSSTLNTMIELSAPNDTMDFAEGTIAHLDKDNNPYYEYIVFHIGTGEEILHKFTPSSPWIIFRWSVPPGETYGVGPVTLLMPTIKSLNQYAKFLIIQGNYALNPPLMYNQMMGWNPFNTPMRPGVMMPVMPSAMNDANNITPLNFGADFNISLEIIQDMRNQITKGLFDQPLGTLQDPVRTATEMEMRQQAAVEEMGVAFGRLSVEFLTKLMKRIIFLLSSTGRLPHIPLDGELFELAFEMPIVQAQGVRNIAKLAQVHEFLTGFMGEELGAAAFKLEDLPLWAGEQAGVDTRLLKSPQEMGQLIQNAAQAMQQQQQM